MRFFLKGDTDAKRVKPLRLNKNKWKKIRPEMKEFVLENWAKWEEEKPAFFTAVFKRRVDDDMVPAGELRRQVAEGGGQRRRSSLGEIMLVGEGRVGAGKEGGGRGRGGERGTTVAPEVVVVAATSAAAEVDNGEIKTDNGGVVVVGGGGGGGGDYN
jgi:hypothetical protein